MLTQALAITPPRTSRKNPQQVCLGEWREAKRPPKVPLGIDKYKSLYRTELTG